MEPSSLIIPFDHARVIIAIVTGLSMARLLAGLARLIQRRTRDEGRSLQLAWALFLMLSVTHFWWFEMGVAPGGHWTFGLYLFTIVYASLFFFTCVVLFPDPRDDAEDFARYFAAHHAWFYGLLASLFAADAVFSSLKGTDHLRLLGSGYAVKQAAMIGLAFVALFTRVPRFQAGFAIVASLTQVWWILRTFDLTP